MAETVTAEPQSVEDLERQLRLLKRQQKALLARDKLMPFMKFTMPDPEDPGDVERSLYENELHHDAIAAAVERVEAGDYQILILTVPPRHGKSEIVSRRLPAWFLGRHPEQNVVVATYNDDFAKDFGADVRSIITSPAYRQVFPDTKLQRGGSAKDRMQTTAGGQATFVGVGGSLTGRGAHVLILDDLIKSYEEARSKSYRDRAWNWFTKVAMTRRMGKKLVIITFTRWDADDIIGRLTDPENEHYSLKLAKKIKIINIPAIAGEDDPLGRKEGEALWPSRFDLDFLEEQKELDPLGFAALYQQSPSLADGDLFKREHVQYYDPETLDWDRLRIYCASDHAVSTKQRADPTCLLKVGLDEQNRLFILECFWKKAPSDVVVEAMLNMASGKYAPLTWWAEKGHISGSIGPFLKKRMMETGTFFHIIEVLPAGDKRQRAQSISARMATGQVYFPKGAWWVENAVNELLAFDGGLKDDFVDAMAYIGVGLQGMVPASKEVAKNKTPKYGTLAWVKASQKQAEMQQKLDGAGGF